MKSRERFVKEEIKIIKNILDYVDNYVPYSSALEDEERLIKIIDLLFETYKKSIILKRIIKVPSNQILYQLL